jgi:hypothetical protein
VKAAPWDGRGEKPCCLVEEEERETAWEEAWRAVAIDEKAETWRTRSLEVQRRSRG